MSIYQLGEMRPDIHETAWIADDANIIGNVELKEDSSIWFCATIRGDNEIVVVGKGANIQENTVLHTDIGFPLTIGENCTIGHKVMLHGCEIGNNTLIGMGAVILNGAKIGDNCLIGAGALITENKVIPDRSLVMGTPGKIVRQLDDTAIERITQSALHYQENAERFRNKLVKVK
jgi:carbonic anhydrase/acetyltransferase-like protein (isoleucine patch superfamily)